MLHKSRLHFTGQGKVLRKAVDTTQDVYIMFIKWLKRFICNFIYLKFDSIVFGLSLIFVFSFLSDCSASLPFLDFQNMTIPTSALKITFRNVYTRHFLKTFSYEIYKVDCYAVNQ